MGAFCLAGALYVALGSHAATVFAPTHLFWKHLLAAAQAWGLAGELLYGIVAAIAIAAPAIVGFVPSLLVYDMLTRPRLDLVHTRCHYCDYILKGIVEPRCPECGRRI